MTTDTYMPKLWVQYDAMHQQNLSIRTYMYLRLPLTGNGIMSEYLDR